jgi:hypothetical protein
MNRKEVVLEVLTDLVLEEVMSGGTLLETNPYHDAQGRFTSKGASALYASGAMGAGRAAGKQAKIAGKSREEIRTAIKQGMERRLATIEKIKAERAPKSASLNKDNNVAWSRDAEGFAKEYVAGQKGDFRSGGPTKSDEKASEDFRTKYDSKEERAGFAGSGSTIYTNKTSEERFRVNRTASGKGFYGTNHFISKVKP